MINLIAHITQQTHIDNSKLSHWTITSPIIVVAILIGLSLVAYRVIKYTKSKNER